MLARAIIRIVWLFRLLSGGGIGNRRAGPLAVCGEGTGAGAAVGTGAARYNCCAVPQVATQCSPLLAPCKAAAASKEANPIRAFIAAHLTPANPLWHAACTCLRMGPNDNKDTQPDKDLATEQRPQPSQAEGDSDTIDDDLERQLD
jgi:hypothetical protein